MKLICTAPVDQTAHPMSSGAVRPPSAVLLQPWQPRQVGANHQRERSCAVFRVPALDEPRSAPLGHVEDDRLGEIRLYDAWRAAGRGAIFTEPVSLTPASPVAV